MAEDLAWHLQTNQTLWEKWLSAGITPGMSFVVDFHFYVPRKDTATALEKTLEAAGFRVTTNAKRTLLFWKGWEITASAKHEWTLEYLNDRTREFCQQADSCGFSFEGLGALMP